MSINLSGSSLSTNISPRINIVDENVKFLFERKKVLDYGLKWLLANSVRVSISIKKYLIFLKIYFAYFSRQLCMRNKPLITYIHIKKFKNQTEEEKI